VNAEMMLKLVQAGQRSERKRILELIAAGDDDIKRAELIALIEAEQL
jgi:hypothetical protein